MSAAALLDRLWALALLYPAHAILAAVVLWMLLVLCVLALVGMLRPELPLHQWEDDDEQQRAVSRPGPLEPPAVSWRRAGGNWWPLR